MNDIAMHNNRRILLIDDNVAIHKDYRKALQQGSDTCELDRAEADLLGRSAQSRAQGRDFAIDSAYQGREGLELVRKSIDACRPYALAFVDMLMPPGWDGLETISQIWGEDPAIQLVICTAHCDYSDLDIARRFGRTDGLLILKKPFEPIEVRQLASALTEKWNLAQQARLKQDALERAVREQTAQVVATRDVTVFALAKLAESRDSETGDHLERMRAYSQILARQLGRSGPYMTQIDDDFLAQLYWSSPLHDIGKVGIPDAILLKPGSLSNEEFEIMKRHAVIGADTLDEIAVHTGAGGFLSMAADIARHHHERWDGSGYPDGLRQYDIPLSARIVALADVYDALTSARVYKSAFDPCISRSMIEQEEDKHFDPAVVEVFRSCYNEFLAVLHRSSEETEVDEHDAPALASLALDGAIP